MYIPPSPMDLCSLAGVKNWLGITNTVDDSNIQACITAASFFFLRQTGRGPRNWQNVNQSPFNQPVSYSEVYDGISGEKLWLRNFPINSLSALTVGGYNVPQSTAATVPGWKIDDQGRAVVIQNGGGGQSPQTFQFVSYYGNGYQAGAGAGQGYRPFAVGAQQISVSYIAGFTAVPAVNQLFTITASWTASTVYTTGAQVSDGTYLQQAQNSGTSGTVVPPWATLLDGQTPDNNITWLNTGVLAAPYTVTIQNDVTTLSDQGVKYFIGGASLSQVFVAPAAGQYFLVAPGNYLFAAADMGAEVMISYTSAGTPSDIVLMMFQLVGLNYKRRNWIGIRSLAMKDVGSTVYTLDLDPTIKAVIEEYKRSALSS